MLGMPGSPGNGPWLFTCTAECPKQFTHLKVSIIQVDDKCLYHPHFTFVKLRHSVVRNLALLRRLVSTCTLLARCRQPMTGISGQGKVLGLTSTGTAFVFRLDVFLAFLGGPRAAEARGSVRHRTPVLPNWELSSLQLPCWGLAGRWSYISVYFSIYGLLIGTLSTRWV